MATPTKTYVVTADNEKDPKNPQIEYTEVSTVGLLASDAIAATITAKVNVLIGLLNPISTTTTTTTTTTPAP